MRRALPLLLLTAACTAKPRADGGAVCGIAAVAGPTLVLSEFNTPGATLTRAPTTLPGQLVARFVAGPAGHAIVGRRGDSLEVGIDGPVPAGHTPGFGVLLMGADGKARGVLVYDGTPILNAPSLGAVTVGAARVPLLGLTVEAGRVEDARCPFFPDSLLQ
ncbi:MAG TPA: hypothetical protein VFI13_08345 [Gemmatimonadales bacterium]|nr:hypothetical protein [Gemmatimonadales bacterium]